MLLVIKTNDMRAHACMHHACMPTVTSHTKYERRQQADTHSSFIYRDINTNIYIYIFMCGMFLLDKMMKMTMMMNQQRLLSRN